MPWRRQHRDRFVADARRDTSMSASPPGRIGKAERLRALARNLGISSAFSPTAIQAPGYNVRHDAHGRPCPRLVEGTALAIALRKCADFGVCSLVRLVGRPSVEVLCTGNRFGSVFVHLGYPDLDLEDSLGPCWAKLPELRLASRPVADICPCPPSGRGRRPIGHTSAAMMCNDVIKQIFAGR
jgi:hypothetical protein